jgi:hypothetical protein
MQFKLARMTCHLPNETLNRDFMLDSRNAHSPWGENNILKKHQLKSEINMKCIMFFNHTHQSHENSIVRQRLGQPKISSTQHSNSILIWIDRWGCFDLANARSGGQQETF